MNLLVIIDSTNQDLSLGVNLNRVMTDLAWATIDGFPYVFEKIVENEDVDELKSGIQEDVEAAVLQTGWKNVKYLYKIGGSVAAFAQPSIVKLNSNT